MPDFYGVIKNNSYYNEDNSMFDNVYYNNYKIIYDGEIYNSVEIKMELIEKGYSFSTYLEEEVVLKAYIEWGNQCLNRFNGIFAIAIWNIKENKLFLARDFVGIKSVYYVKTSDGIIFSNRIDKILKKSSINTVSTYDKIFDLFIFENSNINENTVINNVKILLPGNFLVFSEQIKIASYKKEDMKPLNISQDVVTNIRNIIAESIIIQTIPDTEIFTILFGSNSNIFISMLVSDILKEYNKKLLTFTVNNTPNTVKIIENFNTENITFVDNGEINDIYKILKIKEFPDSLDFYTYYLSLKKAKGYKNICIDGSYSEYIFENTNDNFNERLEILNEEFLKNVNKEFLIEDFFNRKAAKNYKYNYLISRILESREKIANFFNISFRNPICSKELIEYISELNNEQLGIEVFYKAFEDFIDIEKMYLPRARKNYKEYEKVLLNEYIHILDNPTSRIHEVIDKEKAYKLKNMKIIKLIIEFNYWLKEYNINIL